eukprot:157564-Rhodomonas_salina.5
MSGTDLAYGAVHCELNTRNRFPGTNCAENEVSCVGFRGVVDESDSMSGTDLAYVAMGLRACYAMSGTDLSYGAAVGWSDGAVCHRVQATSLAGYRPTRMLCNAPY